MKTNILIVLVFTLQFFFSCTNSELKISKELESDLAQNAFRPISSIKVPDGYNVTKFIDTSIQEVVQNSLLKTLIHYKAEHGCVILMETSTGKIISLVNLGLNESGSYSNIMNYAIGDKIEPGQLMYTYDIMKLSEDNKLDTLKTYNESDTILGDFNDKKNNGTDKITLVKAFETKSNSVIAQAINNIYSNQPESFINGFLKLKLDKKFDIPLPNQSVSVIPSPSDKNWLNTTFSFLSIGYGIALTPLHILTYYNAIANNGVMVKPLFIDEISNQKGEKKKYNKEVLNSKICNDTSLEILHTFLERFVINSDGKNNQSTLVNVSGMTSELKVYSDKNNYEYKSSFVGYFPSSKPKYSFLVLINKPNKSIGYLGAEIAGNVVQDITQKLK